jgi:glycosyltransferase involved in cell wall biosynthesis
VANSTIKPTVLVLSQVYVPDPAAVGQHMADAAAEMARRGYPTRALVSGRGYENPAIKYKPRETINGVDVRRMPLASLGKKTIFHRLLGQTSFLTQITLHGLFTPRPGAILVSTSPPMCSIAALIISRIRGVPITFWAMDLNPDQVIAMGVFKDGSLPVRCFNFLNRRLLGRAREIITLDRFMAARLQKKRNIDGKLTVFPPWPHEDHLEVLPHEANPFRQKHDLAGKFVVMYSGNHSPANPIKTAIDAAASLADDPNLVFMFIGGGGGKKEVDAAIAAGAKNIVSLPYQPLADLKYSLSAADVHLVTIGDGVVGIVHPCKVYGAMAVSRPILFLGPRPSHVSDLLDAHQIGRQVEHGDVDGCIAAIRALQNAPPAERNAMGRRAKGVIDSELSKRVLCGRFGDLIERSMGVARLRSDGSTSASALAR